MKKRLIFLIVVFFALYGQVIAQKHIVVLGSSTAAGTGASTYDSSWVGRLQLHFRKNTSPTDPDTVVTNLAFGGYTTYHVMPTGYPNPFGMPDEDPARNITYALSLNPDLILINLPSNDITWGITKKTTMDNFRVLRQEMNNAGKRWFITTSQPRNLPNPAERDSLRTLVDSIQINFGMFSIDFWNDIVNTDGSNTILPIVNDDGTHVNNLGHRLLFENVIAKELFPSNAPLPVKLTDFRVAFAANKSVLQWQTSDEEPNTSFTIQRSTDGRQFSSVGLVNAQGINGSWQYSWTDATTPSGRIFYRLLIKENNRNSFSQIVSVVNKGKPLAISQVYVHGDMLDITVSSAGNKNAEIELFQVSGVLVKKAQYKLNATAEKITISVPQLPAGEYIIRIRTQDGLTDTERFIRLK